MKNMKIAGYDLHSIPTGFFGLDGGAMFGTVPKVLWEKEQPSDALNRIQMEARVLLLVSDKRKILIDCGLGDSFQTKYGDKLGPKFAQMYGIHGESLMTAELKKHGVTANDITDVVLTHLHFDHAGGATVGFEDQVVSRFPNAQYHLQEDNFKTASAPNLREKASYYDINFQPLIKSGQLNFIQGEKEILPGLFAYISHGHTQGQQSILVRDSQQTLAYCADLIPTRSHVRLPWVMGYDLRPLDLIEEKRKLLEQAAKENWYLFMEHDPTHEIVQVESRGHDFNWRDAV